MKILKRLKDKRALFALPVIALVVAGISTQTPRYQSIFEPEYVEQSEQPISYNTGTDGYVSLPAPQPTSTESSNPQTVAPPEATTQPTAEPAPAVIEESAPAPPPAPYKTGYTKRFEPISETERKQYCDYTYSDGSVQSVFRGTMSNSITLSC